MMKFCNIINGIIQYRFYQTFKKYVQEVKQVAEEEMKEEMEKRKSEMRKVKLDHMMDEETKGGKINPF